MNKRIFILAPFESKMARHGTRNPKLAELLVKAGNNVEYITTNYSHARKEYFSEEEIAFAKKTLPYKLTVLKIFGYKKNISVKRVVGHIYLSIKYFLCLFPRLKKGDTLVLPSRPPELIFCASLLRKLKSASTIVDIRDIWPDMLQTSSKFKNTIFKIYCNLFLYLSLKIIDKYVHTAPSFINWLKRYSPNSQSLFIPLGFDSERWNGMQPLSRSGFNKIINVVYVGGLTFQIDMRHLINALVNSDKYFLTIIGDGDYLKKLKQLVHKNKMQNVEFKGYIPQESVVEELKTQHVALLPMRSYAMPNKLFDYIASYRPVLVLGDNDSSYFVKKYNIGWAQPFDAKDLRQFFEKLSIDEIIEKSKNIEIFRDKFSKDYLYKEYIELIVE